MANPLAEAYARTRPQQVALELEKFTREDVLAFFEELDGSVSVAVMARLSSRMLALIVESLEPRRLATLLAVATPRDAQAVIAHIPGSEYQLVMNAASMTERPVIENYLGVSSQTIAMQTTRRFVRVFAGQTCGSILRELSETSLGDQAPVVATTEESVYLGMVPLTDILQRQHADRQVRDFIVSVAALKADASISSVMNLLEWDEFPVLPVVDREGVLAGTVALKDLRQYRGLLVESPETRLAYSLMDSYVSGCADILDFAFGGRRL